MFMKVETKLRVSNVTTHNPPHLIHTVTEPTTLMYPGMQDPKP